MNIVGSLERSRGRLADVSTGFDCASEGELGFFFSLCLRESLYVAILASQSETNIDTLLCHSLSRLYLKRTLHHISP